MNKRSFYKIVLFLLCVLFFNRLNGQVSNTILPININWNDSTLKLNKRYFNQTWKDSVEFSELKFFISNVRYNNYKSIKNNWSQNIWLIDMDQSDLEYLPLNNDKLITAISFDIGIDSLNNVNGEMVGALDPISGMYWTWQSGFINMKMEGASNLCSNKNHQFQFHLGGYLHPYPSLQHVQFTAPDNSFIKGIKLDLSLFISLINLAKVSTVMSPGPNTVTLSQILSTCFSFETETK